MQLLQAPLLPDQLAGQPIEQFRMRRLAAAEAESFGVSTRPRPKWYCQTRLTIVRAKSGFLSLAIHSAIFRRRSDSGASGARPNSLPLLVSAERPAAAIGSPFCLRIASDEQTRHFRRLLRSAGEGLGVTEAGELLAQVGDFRQQLRFAAGRAAAPPIGRRVPPR